MIINDYHVIVFPLLLLSRGNGWKEPHMATYASMFRSFMALVSWGSAEPWILQELSALPFNQSWWKIWQMGKKYKRGHRISGTQNAEMENICNELKTMMNFNSIPRSSWEAWLHLAVFVQSAVNYIL